MSEQDFKLLTAKHISEKELKLASRSQSEKSAIEQVHAEELSMIQSQMNELSAALKLRQSELDAAKESNKALKDALEAEKHISQQKFAASAAVNEASLSAKVVAEDALRHKEMEVTRPIFFVSNLNPAAR